MGTALPVDFDDDFEVTWEDMHRVELQEEWNDGYELGYTMGKLQAHADLIISLMENLIAAGIRYDKAVSFMAMAFQVSIVCIEKLLPVNFNRENPEKTKSD